MTFSTRILACASTLALAAPAAAQQIATPDVPDSAMWQDVITPSIRVIQRDGQGNVLFDSAGPETAPGASDPQMAEAIARADGETIGATDAREMAGDEVVSIPYAPSPRRARLAASPTPIEGGSQGGTGMMAQVDDAPAPATDGQYGSQQVAGTTVTSPSGMEFDMESFAREMYEQGYRRGYVSGLTEMRTRAVRQMQGEREAFAQQRAAFELQAQQQRRAMREVLDQQAATRAQMQRRGDGSTVIMLPPGMTPQQFLRSLDR